MCEATNSPSPKKNLRTLLPLQGLAESRRSHLLLGLTLSRGSLISRHDVFVCDVLTPAAPVEEKRYDKNNDSRVLQDK